MVKGGDNGYQLGAMLRVGKLPSDNDEEILICSKSAGKVYRSITCGRGFWGSNSELGSL